MSTYTLQARPKDKPAKTITKQTYNEALGYIRQAVKAIMPSMEETAYDLRAIQALESVTEKKSLRITHPLNGAELSVVMEKL